MIAYLVRDRGSVTAEFAVTLPAVLLVLALAVSGIQAGAQQVRLQDAAADAARTLARGDTAGSTAAIARARVPGSSLSSSTRGDLLCATLSARLRGPAGIAGLETSATGCALTDGR